MKILILKACKRESYTELQIVKANYLRSYNNCLSLDKFRFWKPAIIAENHRTVVVGQPEVSELSDLKC